MIFLFQKKKTISEIDNLNIADIYCKWEHLKETVLIVTNHSM